MAGKNNRIFLLFLFICIYCIVCLFFNFTVNAQYMDNNYYEYMMPNLASSYFYNNMYVNSNTAYLNNYSWSMTKDFGKGLNIPTLLIDDWTLHPSFGNTVYVASTEGDSLTIYGTYFSAHTHAGVNFNRTLSFGNSSYSMPYQQPGQTIYQNFGGQSSLSSSLSNYARQVLQFSPVLHGSLLNY